MATRTQKAAMKKNAEAGKAAKATPKASSTARSKAPPKAARAKAGKPAKAPTPPTPKPAKRAPPSRAGASEPTPKPTLGERFWHRVGLGAKAKEERAHQLHLEHEAAVLRKIEQDRRDRERAEEDERAARRAHAAADRRANEKAAREMARIAREEDARLKREAEDERARAIRQAIEDRKAAAAARREQARTAKLREAAEAELAEQDQAAHRREAAAARREAARLARAQAKEDAEREGQERAAAEEQAAEERVAKRREAAEARREKARQGKLAAEAKAEERRMARQRKAEEQAREEEHKARAEELAQLEAEATARRQAQRMEVTIRRKPMAEPEDADGGATGDEEGQAVEADEPEEPVPPRAKANGARGNGAGPAVPTSDLDAQAERVAEELRSRRSKPITLDADDTPVPMLPVARRAREDEPKQVLQLDPAPPARIPEMATPRGLSIPEHFLLLALEDGWDERREKAATGQLGGALVGSLLLELVLQGKLRVQRDRFQITGAEVDDAASAVAATLGGSGDRPSLQAMGDLAKALPELLPAYKDRLAARGLIEHRAWRHLGMFYRSQTALVDADAQERMRSKLARAIAGGGRPDAPTILSLGLLEASGLFGVVVPEGAQAYNRKRLNGLLAGKDVMGYKVDDELKGIQEMAVRTILDNVRIMTVRG